MSVDVVERVRMALAEAGYPGAIVEPAEGFAEGASTFFGVPVEVSWRASVVAGALAHDGLPMPCLQCGLAKIEAARFGAYTYHCLARGLGIEDCGADRG